jgi:hypothetical protein
MTPELARVIALARRRGACVRVVDGETWDRAGGNGPDGRYDQWHEAPFSHISLALDERLRVVYLLDKNADDKDAAGSVVHELAHLHASRRESVDHSNEYGWLGWEIAVAREARVRRAWDFAMGDYGVGEAPAGLEHLDGDEWGTLTQSDKRVVMADRLRIARRRHIVDDRGRAVWFRLPAPEVLLGVDPPAPHPRFRARSRQLLRKVEEASV